MKTTQLRSPAPPSDTLPFRKVQAAAHGVLSRCRDSLTQQLRDDLVQDVTVRSWLAIDRVRDGMCLDGYVRTITRRRRIRWLARERRQAMQSLHDGSLLYQLSDDGRGSGSTKLMVRGVAVDRHRLRGDLNGVLQQLSPLNRLLLTSFYEGFTCVELGERYQLDPECVKVRVHRSRSRVRRDFEVRTDSKLGVYRSRNDPALHHNEKEK